jgi:outer membrane receptor protein involved in Fe transport
MSKDIAPSPANASRSRFHFTQSCSQEFSMPLPKNRHSSRHATLVLALLSSCGVVGIAQAQTASADDTDGPQDIIVTASGRKSTTLDIPYNITARTGEELAKAGVTSIADLSRQIPGMAYTDQGARSNGISNGIILRGLNGSTTTGAITPALGGQMVSIYVNSIPLFSNLKITDVERVEVLRGPQGTLYGAGSIGGTVRFLFNKPDTTAFSADIQGNIGAVADASDPTYAFDAIVNVPISDRFALRFSGGYEKIPGVIDATNLISYGSNGVPLLADPSDYFGSAPVYGKQKDVDDADVSYVRASALWKITDDFEALATIQHQETNASDFTGQSPYGPKREHTRFGTSPSEIDVTLYGLELTADFGFATLTSSTSYSKTDVQSDYDATNYGLGSMGYYAGFPRIASHTEVDFADKNFIQEVRLVSKTGSDWDWVIGGYYSNFKRHQPIKTFIPGWTEYTNTPGNPTAVAALGDPTATWADYNSTIYPDGTFDSDLTYIYDRHIKNTNKAIYGELTYHITPAWSITGGGRIFWVKNDRSSSQEFPMAGAGGAFNATTNTSDSDQIFKINTSYKVSQTMTAYFTWSQGFREGGGNGLPVAGPYAQDPSLLSYKSDFANNYEFGIKGVIANRIRYSAAIYRDDWDDMQVQITAPGGFPALINGGKARSQGVELETQITATSDLDIDLGYAYTDAKLTEDFSRPLFNGFDGDKLPGVPKHSVTGAMTYTLPSPVMGGDLSYHADAAYRSGVHTSVNPGAGNYVELPGFLTINASINWQSDHLRAGIYVKNLTDKAGVTAVAVDGDNLPGDIYFIQRPRTIGVMMGYKF